MMIKTTLSMLAAASLLFSVGCKKADSSSPEGAGSAAPAALAPGEAATYPTMVPMSGTRVVKQSMTVHQSADSTSPVLTRVGPGTWVNLKGSYSNWMMIDYPSGVGKLSPGWVEMRDGDGRTATSATPTAAPAPPPPPPATTGPVITPPGAKTAVPATKVLKINPPKKKN